MQFEGLPESAEVPAKKAAAKTKPEAPPAKDLPKEGDADTAASSKKPEAAAAKPAKSKKQALDELPDDGLLESEGGKRKSRDKPASSKPKKIPKHVGDEEAPEAALPKRRSKKLDEADTKGAEDCEVEEDPSVSRPKKSKKAVEEVLEQFDAPTPEGSSGPPRLSVSSEASDSDSVAPVCKKPAARGRGNGRGRGRGPKASPKPKAKSKTGQSDHEEPGRVRGRGRGRGGSGKTKDGLETSFARRTCPMTAPASTRWKAIRKVYQDIVVPLVEAAGAYKSVWEDGQFLWGYSFSLF